MRTLIPTLALAGLLLVPLTAQDLPARAEVQRLADQAAAWLRAQQQEDGSFLPGDRFKLGITTVAVNALLDAGAAPDDPAIERATNLILTFVQPDGGIYDPHEGLANYGTSLGLKALVRAGKATDEVRTGAQGFLFGIQNKDESSITYGGIGYGSRGGGHEDLSNTAMALDALHTSGVPASHPGMQRALQFLQRCQNLTETNDQPWAENNGGAVYSPDSSMALGSFHDGRENVAEPAEPAEGAGGAAQLNSYGSMTYALITSYIYLDLEPGDPRLAAALAWVKRNYQFDRNPGMPAKQSREGLFYYYQAMAKTFDLLDLAAIEGADGNPLGDWRGDLFNALRERAQVVPGRNGSGEVALWINDMPRWGEGIPHLTTAYALGCLGRILASLPE